MPVLSNSSAARRVGQAAAFSALALVGSTFSSTAQEVALTPDQCRTLRAAVSATFDEFKGKMSPHFAESLSKLSTTCDTTIDILRVPGIDDAPFKQMAVKIRAIRAAPKPVALVR